MTEQEEADIKRIVLDVLDTAISDCKSSHITVNSDGDDVSHESFDFDNFEYVIERMRRDL
jgi:hypothetical protein